jgi:hypothetical protein
VRSEPFFHEAQGFLFSRAVSSTAISDMLLERRAGWLPQADGNEGQGMPQQASPGWFTTDGAVSSATG